VDLIETLRSTGAVPEFTDEPVGDDVVARGMAVITTRPRFPTCWRRSEDRGGGIVE
jgi:hypothetical protein